MKIGIIGTRGIPNHYGGFEQFAEYLSLFLVRKGHDVHVFNSSQHPYKLPVWNDVQITHCKDPENTLGTFGQFIYDFNCIKASRSMDLDIILQLGYTSSSIWGRFLPKDSVVITNMDGLEWKRSKYSALTRRFLKYAERLAIKHSDHFVADSLGIQTYLQNQFGINSTYIPYGAICFNTPDIVELAPFNIQAGTYDLVIARFEPENNIESVIKGYLNSKTDRQLVIVGDYSKTYGQHLYSKYANEEKLVFLGSIFNKKQLDNLRYYSHVYFHGHSVGGTNPSLLEAMATKCLIVAHDNVFNRSILQEDAFYFKTELEISELLKTLTKEENNKKIESNFTKINSIYNWEKVNQSYENLFNEKLMLK